MKRIYLSSIVLLIALLSGLNGNVNAQTTSFTYLSGSVQNYTVPSGCTGVLVDLAGGGGGGYSPANGGKGGRGSCKLAVTL